MKQYKPMLARLAEAPFSSDDYMEKRDFSMTPEPPMLHEKEKVYGYGYGY